MFRPVMWPTLYALLLLLLLLCKEFVKSNGCVAEKKCLLLKFHSTLYY
jgi:hypothetical protein